MPKFTIDLSKLPANCFICKKEFPHNENEWYNMGEAQVQMCSECQEEFHKKEQIEKILGSTLRYYEYKDLKIQWNAFTNEPEKYDDTVVVKMVQQWLQEIRNRA